MSDFMDLVNRAQTAELLEAEKKYEDERKSREVLRKENNPGTISGRELVAPREDAEKQLHLQLDEIDAATRKAEKDAKDAEQSKSEGAFPPPPLVGGGQ